MEDGDACHILDPRKRALSIPYPIVFSLVQGYSCNYEDGKVYLS